VDAGAVMTAVLTQEELAALNPPRKRVRPFKLRAPIPTEADECANLLQWASVTRHKGQRLSDLLVMIPNKVKLTGDARERAIAMNAWKREGFKAGASDYFLAVPTAQHGGLWLEMKRTQGAVTSAEQVTFQMRMREAGYSCALAKGFEQARAAIMEYLCSMPQPQRP
jgi:hypothetical protein